MGRFCREDCPFAQIIVCRGRRPAAAGPRPLEKIMASSLLMTRRFAPLFWCQFFSAFSDNFLKNSLVFLILFHIGGANAESLITLAAAIFIAPYFFLSALGGELADRYDKARVAQRLKLAEIGIAFLAVLGFALHSVPVLFVVLFLFGVIAALFGPIKYGILPDHLARSELPAGNALVEGATFIAILLGTIVGGMAAKDGGDPAHFAFLMIVFSLLCWGASLLIPRTGQAAPDLKVQKNVLRSTVGLVNFLREDPRLWWGALVTSWFWLVGAVALSLMPPLVKNVLGGNEEVVTTCLAIFSVSIAIGSGLAAWLAAGRIILLPTLIGAVLLGLFALDLGFSTLGARQVPGLDGYVAIFASVRGIRFALDLAGIAIAGGLFIVPTFAAVQTWAGADRRARVVAAVNVLNAAFMAGSTVIVAILQTAGMTTSQLFLLLGVASLLVAVAIGRTMPASALSDALSIIYRTLFRMEVNGIDNLNNAGPNLIIALNHVSFLDAGLALSLRNRKPVFAIDVGIAKLWWVRPFMKLTDARPLDPLKPMAVRSLIGEVKAGNALIIFPEGRITVTVIDLHQAAGDGDASFRKDDQRIARPHLFDQGAHRHRLERIERHRVGQLHERAHPPQLRDPDVDCEDRLAVAQRQRQTRVEEAHMVERDDQVGAGIVEIVDAVHLHPEERAIDDRKRIAERAGGHGSADGDGNQEARHAEQ